MKGSTIRYRIWVVLMLVLTLVITSCGSTPTTTTGEPEQVIEIELGDMYVKPDTIEIDAGQNVKLHIKNVGAMVHDLKINGTSGTAELVTGQEETITVGGLTDSVLAWCTLPGHRESGMEMKINVKGMAAHSDYDTVNAPAPAADESAKIDAKGYMAGARPRVASQG
jgi:nitrite reductase (NO-forming)